MTARIREMRQGKIVVIEPENEETVPLFCPLCEFPMKSIEDYISYGTSKTCSRCEMRWSSCKFGKWEDGWRPDSKTEGWEDYIKERIIYAKSIINLR